MNVPARLAGFAALLGIVLGGAAIAGAAIGPLGDAATASGGHEMAGMEHAGHGTMPAAGLAISEDGYTLETEEAHFDPGRPATLAFRIAGPSGRPVRSGYQLESTRELHLIVVRRDGRLYQHLHPTRDATGTWSTRLTLPAAGVYRAYADFEIAGDHHVLATDLFAAGDFRPRALPSPRRTAETGGYTVALQSTGVKAGEESRLTFRVARAGRPVADLQPYLGAKGHLVALREGDLAYLHVHPDTAELGPGQIQFMSTFPTAGRYRLFLQFKADGRVRTVAYTLEVSR